MRIDEMTEADEAATSKQTALKNLAEQLAKDESPAVIDMYERAAWNVGASIAETEAVIRAGAPPTPFGPERAQEIWDKRGLQWSLTNSGITRGERAYVKAIWDTKGGNSCWMDAFLDILHGRVQGPS